MKPITKALEGYVFARLLVTRLESNRSKTHKEMAKKTFFRNWNRENNLNFLLEFPNIGPTNVLTNFYFNWKSREVNNTTSKKSKNSHAKNLFDLMVEWEIETNEKAAGIKAQEIVKYLHDHSTAGFDDVLPPVENVLQVLDVQKSENSKNLLELKETFVNQLQEDEILLDLNTKLNVAIQVAKQEMMKLVTGKNVTDLKNEELVVHRIIKLSLQGSTDSLSLLCVSIVRQLQDLVNEIQFLELKASFNDVVTSLTANDNFQLKQFIKQNAFRNRYGVSTGTNDPEQDVDPAAVWRWEVLEVYEDFWNDEIVTNLELERVRFAKYGNLIDTIDKLMTLSINDPNNATSRMLLENKKKDLMSDLAKSEKDFKESGEESAKPEEEVGDGRQFYPVFRNLQVRSQSVPVSHSHFLFCSFFNICL